MRISEAEWVIMESVWAAPGPLTATDIADRVPTSRDWSLATVKTMLSRLASKGALKHEQDGRRYLYSAAVERSATVRDESKRLVKRLFGGKLTPMIAHLAEDNALTEDDIADIEALLKELKQ
ncbi:MAG: BlaI/MecI/CopY family transcriptional regulator [Sphingomonas sp.]|nr:BlaI/MecI/CopY family transcriptional regulator [Sphingomonas sp.]RZV51294.1 MAG: BlaI/MecI/CopY family transcriptional regulator [Sphingomonadaceae bacterium]